MSGQDIEGETVTTEEFTITLAVIITKRLIYWIVNRDETHTYPSETIPKKYRGRNSPKLIL